MTTDYQIRILKALEQARANWGGSDAKFANSLGISPAQYSRIKNGDTEKVLSEANWISLARRLEVGFRQEAEWRAARTQTFVFVYDILSRCQADSISSIIVDRADVGKTFTARQYVRENRNAVYVDCSQCKTRRQLINEIAKRFGLEAQGTFNDLYKDLVWYLQTIERPLVILDEAGDLVYDAFLELKALWNATEGAAGWVLIGADGLKHKMQRLIEHKKVGYTEIFRRFGKRYQRVSPESSEENRNFARLQAALVAKANINGIHNNEVLERILRQADNSLTRIKTEIKKLTA